MGVDGLLESLERREPAALARAISLVENQGDGFERLLSHVHARLGRGGARRIGITGPPGAGGSPASPASTARCRSGVPNAIAPLLARLSSRCAGCSQVNPIPPCICTHSCAACTAASPQAALARAIATGVSGSPSARQAAAYLAAARAWVSCTHTSASRCLSAWKEPTGRANCRRSLT